MTDFFEQARQCERQAMRHRMYALEETNPILRDLIFDVEEHWLALAQSYEVLQQAMDAATSTKPPNTEKPNHTP